LYPDWWTTGAGSVFPVGVNETLANDITGTSKSFASVVICREAQHPKNLSGGREKLIPSRFLYGLLPQALLDAYLFWQDERTQPASKHSRMDEISEGSFNFYRRLRGYPVSEDGEYLLIVVIEQTGNLDAGSYAANDQPDNTEVLCTGLPGATVHVTRQLKVLAEKEFHFKQKVASSLESHRLLVQPQKKTNVVSDATLKDSVVKFVLSDDVELDHDGSGEIRPAVISRVNDDGSYDVEFVGKFPELCIMNELIYLL
jgi:hypothetical protein